MRPLTKCHSLESQIVGAVRGVTGPGTVALHEPRFAGNEAGYLQECLASTFVSSAGPFVDRFEAELASFTGARFAVAVVNGTAALHVALRLAGVVTGDEVLVPALSFVATANAVAYCNAIPHFVDSEESTLGMDPTALRRHLNEIVDTQAGLSVNRRTGRIIRAVVPMHTFGHPADIDGLLAVARDFRLEVVEDAAESLGSRRGGRHTGTHGRLGTFSFNGNKTITTGGGGAIITDDPVIARRARHLTTTAKVPHPWEYHHDEIGYNYRLPNLNAALGCAQLEQLPAFLSAKRRLFHAYRQAFADIDGVRIMAEPADCASNYWLQVLLLDESRALWRDPVLAATNGTGLMTRPVWKLLHTFEPFRGSPRMSLPVAESLERRIINLPSSAELGMRQPA